MNKISIRTRVVAVVVLALAMTVAQLGGYLPGTSAQEDTLFARQVGDLPATDPAAAAWDAAPAREVVLSGQMSALPFRTTPSAPSLSVRMLVNATHAAFRVTWDDDTLNNRTTSSTDFRDALAILYGPSDALPLICMGGPGVHLQITQWKADWQADIDEGFRDLEHEYPNFWVDYYPGAVGGPPYHLPDAFNETARIYLPGWHVGNPFSEPLKVTPVEEAVAQGFGTLATQAQQDSVGRGTHSGTGWSVVITRPLVSSDAEDIDVETGTLLAFAVWDGGEGDVGARKSVSSWLVVEMPKEESSPVVLIGIGLLALLVVLSVAVPVLWKRRKRPEPIEEPITAEPDTPEEPKEPEPPEGT